MTSTEMPSSQRRPADAPVRVVVAGAGVAGLETLMALRALAGPRVELTLIAPEDEFVYRPMTVREPFAYPSARRYPLARIVHDAGAERPGSGKPAVVKAAPAA